MKTTGRLVFRGVIVAMLLLQGLLAPNLLWPGLVSPPAVEAQAFNCSCVTSIPQAECQALVAVYNATAGATWADKTGWLSTCDPGTWFGVTVAGGRVTELLLSYNNLVGVIPPEIGSLTGLVAFYLDGNQLSGLIPPGIGNLTSLVGIGLSQNQLSGLIPPELGNLTSLSSLNLGANRLSGPIPPQLGNLTNLQDLWLNDNELTGPIPPQLGSLSSLSILSLARNQLSGAIPTELGSLGSLAWLYLNGNHLSGTIPAALGNLPFLSQLRLESNQLSGPIPAQLANLGNLQELWLNNNHLSGAIPATVGGLANLTRLDLHSNHLSGAIPTGIGNLSLLRRLRLDDNALSGEIPASLANLANLQPEPETDLRYNHLTSSNAAVQAFLAARNPGWATTQAPVQDPVGMDVSTPLGAGLSVTYDQVTTAGLTSVATAPEPGVAAPAGVQMRAVFYNLATTTAYAGGVTVIITYDDFGLTAEQEAALQLLQYTGGAWVDATVDLDTDANTIAGRSGSLGWFGLGVPPVVERAIPLLVGWNLVSFDVAPLNGTTPITEVAAILSSIDGLYDSVLGYDQGARSYYPSLPPSFSDLKALDPYHGYWIKMTQAGTLRVAGRPVQDRIPLMLNAGWNLVSYLPDGQMAVAQALASIEGQYTSVLGFHNGGAVSYYPDLPPGFSDLQCLRPGHGYWVNMTTAAPLTYPVSGTCP